MWVVNLLMFKEANLKPRWDGNREVGSLSPWFNTRDSSVLLFVRRLVTTLIGSALFQSKHVWKFKIRREVLTLKCNCNSLKICGALWDNATLPVHWTTGGCSHPWSQTCAKTIYHSRKNWLSDSLLGLYTCPLICIWMALKCDRWP